MKKILKVLVILILLAIVLLILKNILLYFTYNLDVEYLTKVSEKNYEVYKARIDTYQDGYDLQKDITVNIFPDSTGTYEVDNYYFKIHGDVSDYFTFYSLLPYKRENPQKYINKFHLDNQYMQIFEYGDTTFTKYKIENGNLYLDKNGRFSHYNDKPEWGFQFNSSPDFIEMFRFWNF